MGNKFLHLRHPGSECSGRGPVTTQTILLGISRIPCKGIVLESFEGDGFTCTGRCGNGRCLNLCHLLRGGLLLRHFRSFLSRPPRGPAYPDWMAFSFPPDSTASGGRLFCLHRKRFLSWAQPAPSCYSVALRQNAWLRAFWKGEPEGTGLAAINMLRLIATPIKKCNARAAHNANVNGNSFLARCLRETRLISFDLRRQCRIESLPGFGPHPNSNHFSVRNILVCAQYEIHVWFLF